MNKVLGSPMKELDDFFPKYFPPATDVDKIWISLQKSTLTIPTKESV
jgi:hypothetical protein